MSAAGRVGQHHGDEERAEAARPAGGQRVGRLVDGVERAHAAADDDAGGDARRVIGQPGVGQRLPGGGQGQLRQPGHAAGLLAAEVGHRVEALHLAGDARLVVGGVEEGDGADAGAAGADGLPGRGRVVAEGVEGAEAGGDDSSVVGDGAAGVGYGHGWVV
jgi:hypothetical protein